MLCDSSVKCAVLPEPVEEIVIRGDNISSTVIDGRFNRQLPPAITFTENQPGLLR